MTMVNLLRARHSFIPYSSSALSLGTKLSASVKRSAWISVTSETLVIHDLAGSRAGMAKVQHVAVSAK